MAGTGEDYVIPFGVDAAPFLQGIGQMETATEELFNISETAGKNISTAYAKAQAGASSAATAGKAYNQVLTGTTADSQSLFQITQKIAQVQGQLFTATSRADITKYNQEIQKLELELKNLANVGKVGFDGVGNAVKGAQASLSEAGDVIEKTASKTNLLSDGFGFIRKAAYLIPGIGIAGIFNLIGEGVVALAKQLIQAGDNFDVIAEKTKNLSEIQQDANKDASEQITDLQILYKVATDVTQSTKDRTDAVKALKAEFPDTFKDISTETILNGNAKTAYDNLTSSILDNARAKAAVNKLQEIENQLLDIAFQKQKIQNANAAENARAAPESFGGAGGAAQGLTKADVINANNLRAQDALNEQAVQEKRLQQQADFITKFAGGTVKLAQVIEKQNTDTTKAAVDNADAEEKAFLSLLDKLNAQDQTLKAKSIGDDEESQIAASDARFEKIKADAQREVDFAKVNDDQRAELQKAANQVFIDADSAAATARLAIQQKFADAQKKLEDAANKAIDELGDDHYAQELAKINEHYAQVTDTIRKGGKLTASVQLQIENDRVTAIEAAAIKNGDKTIEQNEKLAVAGIENDEKYASKSVGIQKAKQLAILNVELDAAKQRLALLLANGKTEDDLEVKQAEAAIKNLQASIKSTTDNKGKGQTLFEFLGINADSQKDVEMYAKATSEAGKITSDFLGSLADATQEQLDQKKAIVDQDNKDLDDLQTRLSKEEDLRSQGLANNVDVLQQELAAKTAQRDADLKNQQEVQNKQNALKKAQIIADSVAQVSNLITASTEIFEAFSSIPIVGVPLAIAAIGLMFGAFAIAKVNAFKSVGSTTTMGEGGTVDGPSHAAGGVKYRSMDGSGRVVELEGGEFVTNKKSTRKYSRFLDAINNDRLDGMDEEGLRAMFATLGINFGAEATREAVKVVNVNKKISHELSIRDTQSDTGKDIKLISQNVSYLAEKERGRVERWEDKQYTYERRGTKTTRYKK